MKKLILITILSMMSLATFGQEVKEKDVPQIVSKALYKNYPAAKSVKWEKEKNNYEASFELNKTETSVVLTSKGNIVETEVEIITAQLPKKVMDYLRTNFKNEKIKEAAKITDAKGTVTYEAEIKGKDLLFDANGNFISLKED